MHARSLAAFSCALAALSAGSPASAAQEPTLMGSYRDWHVYSAGTGPERTCFAVTPPKDMSPPGANRNGVFFMITSWPGRNVKNQPSVVPGYPYREMSRAGVEIGADKFDFFTKDDGNAGGAWMETAEDEVKLIAAMRRGSAMVVTGTSARGTLTKDNYSLAGISAALDKLASDCK